MVSVDLCPGIYDNPGDMEKLKSSFIHLFIVQRCSKTPYSVLAVPNAVLGTEDTSSPSILLSLNVAPGRQIKITEVIFK